MSLMLKVLPLLATPGRIDCVESWAIFVEQPEGHYRVRLRSKSIVINEIAKRRGWWRPLQLVVPIPTSLKKTNKSLKKSKDTVARAIHRRHRVRLMGTVIDVSIYHKEPEPLLDQVEALLHTYNKRFSANDDSSELMKINKAKSLHPVTVHPELLNLFLLEMA